MSIIKFIEYNWSLPTISKRSRDNLPNPMQDPDNPWANPYALFFWVIGTFQGGANVYVCQLNLTTRLLYS